ncbi:Pkinase-domain-containing protein [Rickenella mellea]|uniref:non-specific serine/threonine protein kinase n=1 Tax=Rickenella mellea TaxID=50990 RepID=A0A4Y7Q7Y7_9AGAM|nr:Pkinase-domain-containing protein [Rickenella mellea]
MSAVSNGYKNESETPRLPRTGRKSGDPRMIGGWKIGRTIGKGSSGRVKIARHAKTGQYAAIKIVSKTALANSRVSLRHLGDEADRILLGLEREIVIMKLMDHPNVMRLYDVWETSGELYLILEYVEGGELFDYICEKGRLPNDEALNYFQQIICAMDYCHRFNIAHRDLKPENLLLDQNKNIKVADFGMAAWQGRGDEDMLETACGSPHYAAPEVVMGQAYDGSAADIWSCGVILYALLAGRLPFDDQNLHVLLEKVKVGRFVSPDDIDPAAHDLITKMLVKDVSKRITMEGILAHPWFTSKAQQGTGYRPPSLQEIARPVASASQIDADIFGNLRTLWHDAPDEDIIDGLTNDKVTWEKGVYHLLQKYRAKHLENYPGDKSKHSRHRKRAAKEHPVTAAPVVPPIRRTTSQLSHLGSARPPSPHTPRAECHSPRATSHCPRSRDVDACQPLTLNLPRARSSDELPSPVSPMSPIWDALDIPPIPVPEDENVQLFFQQIVDHLNMMQKPSPFTSEPSLDDKLDQNLDTFSHLRVRHDAQNKKIHGNSNAPPPTPASGTFHLGDFLIVDKPYIQPGRRTEDEKENKSPNIPTKLRKASGPTNNINVAKKSSLRIKGDEEKRSALSQKRVQIILPTEIDCVNPPRTSIADPMSPTSSDSSAFLPSPSAPRRSWFGNLFKFKPASFQLLSVHDASTSRDECRRILASMGIRTVLAQAEEFGILKCKLDEIRDPAGVMAVAKAVQFRVVVHSATHSQSNAGYAVSLVMIQEKGALSSFKLVYNRLLREWDMDIPRTALSPPSPALSTGGRFAEVIYDD